MTDSYAVALYKKITGSRCGRLSRPRARRRSAIFPRPLPSLAAEPLRERQRRFHVRPAAPARRLRVPGDKSISHRSIMLGALAEASRR